jgi:branched-subunit amino acid aminotransferase/4-amino-4-deoxychorismate lyase
VVWPDAPRLDGITMLVLQHELRARGIPQAEAAVRVQDLPACHGMILCNSHGWAPVGRVDDTPVRHDGAFTRTIAAAYAACPLDPI